MISDNEDDNFYFIRQREVTLLTSIPKSSIPIEIEEGNFPAPVEVSTRSRAWLKSEVLAWMRQKLKERNKKQQEEENNELY